VIYAARLDGIYHFRTCGAKKQMADNHLLKKLLEDKKRLPSEPEFTFPNPFIS